MKFRETIEIDSNYNPERRIVIYQFAFMDFNIPNEVIDIEDITSSINWAAMFGIIIETLFTITKKILFAVVCFTYRIFLGFKFLVRNKEKNEIPCQGMRKKMKFLVKEQGKFEEFSDLYFYPIYQNSEQNRCKIFSKKTFILWDTIFVTPI